MAQARLKGLDQTKPNPAPGKKQHKDVNTFINNQLKFVPSNNQIPPEQMKCNILKAKAEGHYRKRMYNLQFIYVTSVILNP